MKVLYKNVLKKFSVEDIKQMRKMKSDGLPAKIIAKVFNCHQTTVEWHTADIIDKNIKEHL